MRLNDAASGTGRSLNKEIVDRLGAELARPLPRRHRSGSTRDHMRIFRGKRTALVLAATVAVLAAVLAGLVTTSRTHSASPQSSVKIKLAGKELQRSSQGGVANGGGGGESADLFAAQQQWDNTRTAPGIVAPGAYSAAFASLQGLSATPGSWNEVTRVPYDADDPDYRDYYSNSSGGSGLVTGRITALAIGKDGDRLRGGADGGVWRSTTGRGSWTPIADACRRSRRATSQSTRPARSGTRPAKRTPAAPRTSAAASTASPTRRAGTFSPSNRIGGTELESTTIDAAALLDRHRLRGDAARRLLALGQRPRHDAMEAALRAEPVATCRVARTSGAQNAGVQEHRQRPRSRSEEREAHRRGRRLAQRCDVQRLLRVDATRGATWTKINPTRRDQRRRTSATRRSRSRPTAASST